MYKQLEKWTDRKLYEAIVENEASIARSKSIDPVQYQFVRCLRAEYEERRRAA